MIVLMNEQAQSKFMHSVALGKGKGPAYEASEALAQRVVEAFDVAGFARPLAGAAVRAPGEDFGVGQPQVAAAGPAAVGWRDACMQGAAL